MKATTIALALAGALTVSALEPCAQVCQDNMNSLASGFGCAAGDYACLCKVPEWGYGIHDCAWGSCLNDKAKAQPVIDWAKAECLKAGVTVVIPDADKPAVEGGSGSGNGGGSGGGVGILTTATWTSTITTDGATTVVVGTTTISGTVTGGAGGASGVPTATTSAFTTVVTSDGTAITSTGTAIISSPTGSAGTGASTGTGTDGSTLETSVTPGASSGAGPSPSGSGTTGAGTSTSSGLAAQMTAAPFAGFLAAAGIAAALL